MGILSRFWRKLEEMKNCYTHQRYYRILMQAAERDFTDDVPDLSEDQEVETVILGHICVDGGDGHQGSVG